MFRASRYYWFERMCLNIIVVVRQQQSQPITPNATNRCSKQSLKLHLICICGINFLKIYNFFRWVKNTRKCVNFMQRFVATEIHALIVKIQFLIILSAKEPKMLMHEPISDAETINSNLSSEDQTTDLMGISQAVYKLECFKYQLMDFGFTQMVKLFCPKCPQRAEKHQQEAQKYLKAGKNKRAAKEAELALACLNRDSALFQELLIVLLQCRIKTGELTVSRQIIDSMQPIQKTANQMRFLHLKLQFCLRCRDETQLKQDLGTLQCLINNSASNDVQFEAIFTYVQACLFLDKIQHVSQKLQGWLRSLIGAGSCDHVQIARIYCILGQLAHMQGCKEVQYHHLCSAGEVLALTDGQHELLLEIQCSKIQNLLDRSEVHRFHMTLQKVLRIIPKRILCGSARFMHTCRLVLSSPHLRTNEACRQQLARLSCEAESLNQPYTPERKASGCVC